MCVHRPSTEATVRSRKGPGPRPMPWPVPVVVALDVVSDLVQLRPWQPGTVYVPATVPWPEGPLGIGPAPARAQARAHMHCGGAAAALMPARVMMSQSQYTYVYRLAAAAAVARACKGQPALPAPGGWHSHGEREGAWAAPDAKGRHPGFRCAGVVVCK